MYGTQCLSTFRMYCILLFLCALLASRMTCFQSSSLGADVTDEAMWNPTVLITDGTGGGQVRRRDLSAVYNADDWIPIGLICLVHSKITSKNAIDGVYIRKVMVSFYINWGYTEIMLSHMAQEATFCWV